MEAKLTKDIEEHIALFQKLRDGYLGEVEAIGRLLWKRLEQGHKILVAGNGGSAADAQHFAAELVGRYLVERRSLPAIALTTDTSILTAVGNDYGYDQVFSRQLEGLGREGDVFIGISTSGNSENLVRAMNSAKKIGVTNVALVGKGGGRMKPLADVALVVPSDHTPRIQEGQQWIWHTWCDLIDQFHG
ncbi:D-sedoheptulose-7-phosphate isomerase [Acanthopleuribacter pedis]|uniref:Phosphoheptose isomerase n=1 Tax=Acanthopleuribacter pedis TaxID=442870 RepID=A0A8J7QNM3_9BACT|nr:D-sedoheptulose 7-phosphate isomerase [Acanthopleuribacter pedis]MBO1321340.1 D-sedoheptulose 7-phosphate isomerase [Acanthopleuribacter pedis]